MEKAKEKFLKAESIQVGKGAYNLACIASLQKNFKECQGWLKLSKREDSEFLDSADIKTDADLNNFKNHPEYKQWFEDFVEEVHREEQEAKGANPKDEES